MSKLAGLPDLLVRSCASCGLHGNRRCRGDLRPGRVGRRVVLSVLPVMVMLVVVVVIVVVVRGAPLSVVALVLVSLQGCRGCLLRL